jgi:hypothetical protein
MGSATDELNGAIARVRPGGSELSLLRLRDSETRDALATVVLGLLVEVLVLEQVP